MIWKIKSVLVRTSLYKRYKIYRAKYAMMLHGNSSKSMFVVGITGTNGKTTSSFMIHHIFNTLINKTFLLGTNEIKFWDKSIVNTTKMTSPDAMQVQKYLSQAKQEWCFIAILEVASHALKQERFYGVEFDMAILTNITPEHLDYHNTMDEYAQVKKRLFEAVSSNHKVNKMAVFPKDDKYGRQWVDDFSIEKTITFGIISSGALSAEQINYSLDHTSFMVNYMGKRLPMTINMVGMHNVYNTLTALSAGLLVGLELEKMIETLKSFVAPSWRMEIVKKNNVTYFVDFAHTPDGLEKTLSYMTQVKKDGRILLLTWAMGGRDRYKRPEMGKIADQYADIIVLADEDPDQESRFQIIQEVRSGIKRTDGDNLYIIPDRSKAIQFLTDIAEPGDLVLLAGKGHETVMSVAWGRIPWNEKGILEWYLQQKK